MIPEKGLVFANFSSRNFERLDTFMNIAKDAYMLDIMKCADGMDRMSELLVPAPLNQTPAPSPESSQAQALARLRP